MITKRRPKIVVLRDECLPPRCLRYFEPPRWWPGWLHRITCTHCRGLSSRVRALERAL